MEVLKDVRLRDVNLVIDDIPGNNLYNYYISRKKYGLGLDQGKKI